MHITGRNGFLFRLQLSYTYKLELDITHAESELTNSID